ncbi:MAG: alpha/beta hydrolase fold domain-containing protein [Flavobacteriaceae bacterium]
MLPSLLWSHQHFNLGEVLSPRFEVTDKQWPLAVGDASVCLWDNDKLAALTITIDDNNEQDLVFWTEMQEKYPFKFTWFVITAAKREMNVSCWDCFKSLAKKGHAIQGHDDRNWYEKPSEAPKNTSLKVYNRRLWKTQETINEQLGTQECITYAYPWGEGLESEVARHYIATRGVLGQPNTANTINFNRVNSISNPHIYQDKDSRDAYLLPILTKTNTLRDTNYYRGWLSIHFHHISDGGRETTDDFLSYLQEKEDRLWIATFPQVAKYAQEYATHSLTVDAVSTEEISFSLHDAMKDSLYDQPLTVKVRIANNWEAVEVQQQREPIPFELISHNENRYALVKAIPDQGQVVLRATKLSDQPINSSRSRLESATLTNAFHESSTLSPEAQKILLQLSRTGRTTTLPQANAPKQEWIEFQRNLDSIVQSGLQPLKDHYQPVLDTIAIGGIRVIDVKPQGYQQTDKVLAYVHGGAYVALSADTSLASVLPLAQATGLRIVAIDYTLAPHAQFQQTTDEILQCYQGLLQTYRPKNIAFYGDSAGGALAAASILKMRDQGLPLPAALAVWSPWSDIDQIGDTYHTLADNDPSLVYHGYLGNAALAYAPKKEFKNPYVSPVYGDFSKNFPPTLIQAGSKEIFLSNAIRLYRALDDEGKDVKLDVYEGMWHVWQGHYLLPESKKAVENTKKFILKHLGKP